MISKSYAVSLLKTWGRYRHLEIARNLEFKGGSMVPKSGQSLEEDADIPPPPLSDEVMEAVNQTLQLLHGDNYSLIRSIYYSGAPDNNPRLGQALDAFCQKYTG